MLRTGGVPTFLTVIVLAVTDGLFALYGSERRDELFMAALPPVTNRPYVAAMDAKHHKKKIMTHCEELIVWESSNWEEG